MKTCYKIGQSRTLIHRTSNLCNPTAFHRPRPWQTIGKSTRRDKKHNIYFRRVCYKCSIFEKLSTGTAQQWLFLVLKVVFHVVVVISEVLHLSTRRHCSRCCMAHFWHAPTIKAIMRHVPITTPLRIRSSTGI